MHPLLSVFCQYGCRNFLTDCRSIAPQNKGADPLGQTLRQKGACGCAILSVFWCEMETNVPETAGFQIQTMLYVQLSAPFLRQGWDFSCSTTALGVNRLAIVVMMPMSNEQG